jgi:hypothetical protein
MLSNKQLVDRLRSELAPLRPRVDLAERVREEAGTSTGFSSRARSPGRAGRSRLPALTLAVVASALVAVAGGALILVLNGSNPQPKPTTSPVGQSHASRASTLPSARPSAGPVTCTAEGVCRQGRRQVRNPSGSICGQGRTWTAKTTAPETSYGCASTMAIGY